MSMNNHLYICDKCGSINLHWGHCWSCGYDDLTPEAELQKLYDLSRTALEKFEKFKDDDFMYDGRLTREIEEAEKRNWE